MLTAKEKTSINKELKAITEEYKRSYQILQQKSEQKYKTTLRPGEVFHKRDGFYYEEDRREFQDICNKLSAKAHELVDSVATSLTEQNTAAPSTEAANVVMLMSARKDVSADEIDQLMTRYGHDCPMVYRALYEKAQSLGYHDFKQHPITEDADNVNALITSIDRTFQAQSAEHSLVISAAAFDATTDAAFPATE